MLNQSLRRALLAPDLEMRVHALLEELWNADDLMLRHHFRMLFLGVKPSCADFLLNVAIALQTGKTPEDQSSGVFVTRRDRFYF